MQAARPDVCVIGGGVSGLATAAAAVGMGARVLVVDPNIRQTYPSSGLKLPELLNSAPRPSAELHYSVLREQFSSLESELEPFDWGANSVVTTIRSHARFLNPETVEAAGTLICAGHFVLAVGATTFPPTSHSLTSVPHYSIETIAGHQQHLSDVVVVGGGPTGVELSQDIRRSGARVRLATAGKVLSNHDPEGADLVRTSLRQQGIELLEHRGLRNSQQMHGGVLLHFYGDGGHEEVLCSDLVIATGRRPNLDLLSLENAAVGEGIKGIVVDDMLRTTNTRCSAIGDCIGVPMSAHGARYQARVAVENILGSKKRTIDWGLIPNVVYGEVELAQLGLTEAEARVEHARPLILRRRFRPLGHTASLDRPDGVLKVVIANGDVVGVTVAGPEAAELIVPWCLAYAGQRRVPDIEDIVLPPSTLAEFSTAVAKLAGKTQLSIGDRIMALLDRSR